MINSFWDKLEEIIKISWLILLSIFTPIRVPIIVMMFFFTLNFFIGFKNDQFVHGRDFSLKKAIGGCMLFGLFFALVFIVNMSLSLYNEIDLAETASKFLSWIFCYWYLVNIVRNSIEIFPESRSLKFIYSLLTVQILDMMLARFGLRKPDDFDHDSKEKEKVD
jgi:hypothetical protein